MTRLGAAAAVAVAERVAGAILLSFYQSKMVDLENAEMRGT